MTGEAHFLEPERWAHAFLDYLEHEKGASVYTCRNYRQSLLEASEYFTGKRWDGMRYEDFRQYLFHLLKQQKLQGASVRLRFSALRSFYRFAIKTERVKENPVESLRFPSKERRLPRFFSEEQIEDFLGAPLREMKRACDRGGQGKKKGVWRFLRDAAILEFLYSTGMRISELTGLRDTDVDFKSGTVRVLGKGKKERMVVFGEPAAEAYWRYREALPEKWAKDGMFLFVNPSGKSLSARSVQMMFKKYLAEAGLDPKLTPHKVRHSFATHLLDRGADLRSVQELLGHAHLTATQVYTQVTAERLRKAYDEAHPKS